MSKVYLVTIVTPEVPRYFRRPIEACTIASCFRAEGLYVHTDGAFEEVGNDGRNCISGSKVNLDSLI